MEILIISGLSGAGKSKAASFLDYFLSLQQANDALTALSATLTDQQRALLDSYEDASAAAGSAYQDAYARRAFLLAREVYR